MCGGLVWCLLIVKVSETIMPSMGKLLYLKPEEKNSSNYVFSRKAGKSIIERKPLFSPDGESLLVIVENTVRIYSIQTGDYVRILETESPVNELISIQFAENNSYNLFGCSDTGLLVVWTWENGAVIRELELKLPEKAKILTFDMLDVNTCLITGKSDSRTDVYLAKFSVVNGELVTQYRAGIPFYSFIHVAIGVCDGDKYAAICNMTKCIFMQNLVQPHLKNQIFNHNGHRIVSVSANPRDNSIAIGDALGRVIVLRGYLFDYKSIAREVMHWHYLPPLAVSFSNEGSFLISGGIERVLVRWSIGNLANKASEKEFIPRLPGTVKFIATNNSHVAVSMTNNSIVIASMQMRVVTTILECGGLSAVAKSLRTPLVYHKPLNALLLGGKTGHLQLYSPNSEKVLYNIDITQTNSLPVARDNMIPLELEVSCAAISADGAWLVTSEYRNDGVSYPEERLKFWAFNPSGYALNTCVNLSHGGCIITSICVNHTAEFCVTSGQDQKFRIWGREVTDKKTMWSCLTACYYSTGVSALVSGHILNNFKVADFKIPEENPKYDYMFHERVGKNDVIANIINNKTDYIRSYDTEAPKDSLSLGDVDISCDGSLVGAWVGSKISLWDTHGRSLRATLTHPAVRRQGRLRFGHTDAAHYLVSATDDGLIVWSLLTLSMKWRVGLKASCLTADPFSNKMAVVTKDNDVFVFSPQSPGEVLVRRAVLPAAAGVIDRCTFGHGSADDVTLYLMRNSAEIYSIEPKQNDVVRLEAIQTRNLPLSNFSAMIAEQQVSEVKATQPASLDYLDSSGLGKQAINQFMSAPHMMPPVSLVSAPFLEYISGKQTQVDEQQLGAPMEIEDSSDDEQTDKHEKEANRPVLWTPNYEETKEKKLKKIINEGLVEVELIFGT